MEKAGIQPRIMIDCSHANSNKDYTRQSIVCHDVAGQIASGNRNIIGVMIESNLVAGAQQLIPGQPLTYGQSITDGCIDWAETHSLLGKLAAAVRARRSAQKSLKRSDRIYLPIGPPFPCADILCFIPDITGFAYAPFPSCRSNETGPRRRFPPSK